MSYHQCREQYAKRRSGSVRLPICKKNGIETGDGVERKNQPSEKVTGTCCEEFTRNLL